MYPAKKQEKQQDRIIINHGIRASRVLCIDNGKNLGVISLSEALKLAQEQGLDLIQVNNNKPPTCKILDYGKLKYDESKKKKQEAKKQRESEIKLHEIRMRPTTDSNDISIKARKAQEFLNEGDRVKVSVVFKRMELAHKEIGYRTLQEFLSLLPDAEAISQISMESKFLSVSLQKKAA